MKLLCNLISCHKPRIKCKFCSLETIFVHILDIKFNPVTLTLQGHKFKLKCYYLMGLLDPFIFVLHKKDLELDSIKVTRSNEKVQLLVTP